MYAFPKKHSFLAPLERVIGDGLVFSEGDSWKHKRKILNRVFNFQMVKSLAGKISQICDHSIRTIELEAKKVDGYL